MLLKISSLILLVASGLLAQPAVEPEVALAKVKVFAFGGVGLVGVRSNGERQYDEIMSRPNRREILERVFEKGTVEAKSYALVGMYRLDRARFDVWASMLRSSALQVSTASGCIRYGVSLSSVVKRIEAGEYALYI